MPHWRLIYAVVRIRGAKLAVRFVPLSADALLPLLNFAEVILFSLSLFFYIVYAHIYVISMIKRVRGIGNEWYSCYIALLWLGMLVLLPFKFAVLADESMPARILALVRIRLADAG